MNHVRVYLSLESQAVSLLAVQEAYGTCSCQYLWMDAFVPGKTALGLRPLVGSISFSREVEGTGWLGQR